MEKKKKILIIEDEPALRSVLQEKLESQGFGILTAKNGQEGLELAIKEEPELIVLDVVMPRMDGFVMIEKLRHDPWGKDAKVIILTNLSGQEYILRASNNQVYDFIIKSDVRIEDLVKQIKLRLE